jgi:hypothetical protein
MLGPNRYETLGLSLATLIVLAGCVPRPETELQVESINALGPTGEPVGDLFSDVCQGVPPQCIVTNDNALATLITRAENPFTDISRFGDIIVQRYRVTYLRADGRNTAGLEVPYSFDGVVNFRVPVNVAVSQQLMVVRPQAKLEPPLRNLAFGGGSIAFSVVAQIDFYGRDVVNDRGVTARGFLNITFADFANP